MKDTVTSLLSDLQKGKLVVVVDARDREHEADLIGAGEFVTPKQIAFMARFGRGLICAPLTEKRASKLELSLVPSQYTKPLQHCNFTGSVDAVAGVTTGISAFDRAATIRQLADSASKASDFSRPGHVFPLIAMYDGLLQRPGHTEATVDLLRLAGLTPVGVLCEIMGDDGRMVRGKALRMFAKRHRLRVATIGEIIAYRKKHECLVKREVVTAIPTPWGTFKIVAYRDLQDSKEHLALVKGNIAAAIAPVLTRIHSECLTGDVFHSGRCDCYDQLQCALKQISEAGCGVLLYMRHEGRGIGLINKLKAYVWQDKGLDTVEANEKLGFPADARDFRPAAHMLADLGVKAVALLTNNPEKMTTLKQASIVVAKRVPLEKVTSDPKLQNYLRTKRNKLGHFLKQV